MSQQTAVALVTGGAKRVGRAIVLELARAGSDVAIHCHRSAAQARQVAEEVAALGRKAMVIEADLADLAAWTQVVGQAMDAFGRLDTLVNNAALFEPDRPRTIEPAPDDRAARDEQTTPAGQVAPNRESTADRRPTSQAPPLGPIDPALWERMWRINLLAPAGLCHAAAGHLEAHGDGRIVNLCDIAATRPWSTHLAYCSSKAALVSLTQGLAKALAPAVRVNGVSPGIAIFPNHYSASERRRLTRQVPLKRTGTPAEVAQLVAFLCQPRGYVTGQVISIDGGRGLA